MNAILEHPPDSRLSSENSPQATRILVVDDSVVNQRLTLALLKQRGYDARAVGDGREAVRILCVDAAPFDVVLMDCHMPEMDGFEATAAIRGRAGRNKDIVIIALTGTLEDTQIVRCDDSGMNGYLGKPIKMDEFEQTLQRCRQSKIASQPPPKSEPTPSNQRAPFWDAERLTKLRNTMGDEAEEFIAEMLGMFVADLPRLIESVQSAVEASDSEALQEAAHRFKGASRNLGLIRMSDVCLKFEEMGKAGDLSAAMYWFKRLQGIANQVPDKAREELGVSLPT